MFIEVTNLDTKEPLTVNFDQIVSFSANVQDRQLTNLYFIGGKGPATVAIPYAALFAIVEAKRHES